MSLAGTAKETLEIIDRGSYRAPSGAIVDCAKEIERAVSGTRLYRPDELARLVAAGPSVKTAGLPELEVVAETTASGARRLIEVAGLRGAADGCRLKKRRARALVAAGRERVAALNFASAKNPGGGFLGGAKAQEEDLARCSALYTCQLTQREYYDANRAHDSLLYTDHLIYSPDVPFFRDERLDLLEKIFLVSVITSPAPNAGEVLRRDPKAQPAIRAALDRRAAMVLAAARDRGHRTLVLGAWGCGVFRNDPTEVAEVFAKHLASARFAGAFDRVCFSIWDGTKNKPVLSAFERQFAR